MRRAAEADRRLESDLRGAIERRELFLVYQPLLRLDDGSMSGVEALVRWRHPARGVVPPGEFIPVAERCGLIGAIDGFVLDEACRQLAAWTDAGGGRLEDLTMAVNVSGGELRDPGLVGRVASALERHRIAPTRLHLEITESAMIGELGPAAQTIAALAALGARIALDDFGTGYSTLANVQQLPADILKIDRCFVAQIDAQPRDREILAAVVAMAHALAMTVVAEGVETEAQREHLVALDCDQGQGYLFAAPLDAAEIPRVGARTTCRRSSTVATPDRAAAGDVDPRGRPRISSAGVGSGSPRIDPLEAEFRLRSTRTGAWVTLIVCGPALVYALLGGGRSDRTVFLAAFVVAFLGGLAAFVVPWRAVIRSRWRELAFLAWTTMDLAVIGIAAAADGGPASPVAALFFIPIVFAGTSYPPWSLKLVSLIATIGYVVLALAYAQSPGRSVIAFGAFGGVVLMSWWQARSHEHRADRLARMSLTDPLTGALNRRGMDTAAASAFAALERSGTRVALLILDLDDFKAYNDIHGHIAGDELLSWTADQIRRTLRPSDALARMGGDEFAILAADADATAAARLAERIQSACGTCAPHSIGIATAPADGHDYDSLYRVADGALYDDKVRRTHAGDRPPAERPAEARPGCARPAPGLRPSVS